LALRSSLGASLPAMGGTRVVGDQRLDGHDWTCMMIVFRSWERANAMAAIPPTSHSTWISSNNYLKFARIILFLNVISVAGSRISLASRDDIC
jgi:hypothetical protein